VSSTISSESPETKESSSFVSASRSYMATTTRSAGACGDVTGRLRIAAGVVVRDIGSAEYSGGGCPMGCGEDIDASGVGVSRRCWKCCEICTVLAEGSGSITMTKGAP
jgi:hypothetical protein